MCNMLSTLKSITTLSAPDRAKEGTCVSQKDEIQHVWEFCVRHQDTKLPENPRHKVETTYRNGRTWLNMGWSPAGSHAPSASLFIFFILGLGKRNMPKSFILPENRSSRLIFLAPFCYVDQRDRDVTVWEKRPNRRKGQERGKWDAVIASAQISIWVRQKESKN